MRQKKRGKEAHAPLPLPLTKWFGYLLKFACTERSELVIVMLHTGFVLGLQAPKTLPLQFNKRLF